MRDREAVRLWDGVAPGSASWVHEEMIGAGGMVRNVVVPTLTPVLPDQPTDRAVIVAPGGALHFLSIDNEGFAVAEFLRDAGYAAFVLKYRVIPTPVDEAEFGVALRDAFMTGLDKIGRTVLPMAAADAARAVEAVRADGYRHVSMIGFSAGGRVTADAVFAEGSARPDAAGIIYLPSWDKPRVDPTAPPLFLLAAADDPLGVGGMHELHRAWVEAKVPVELHLFEKGGHGFGYGVRGGDLPIGHWPDLFLAWLDQQGR
jgi:acetyl esterase/lipase